MKSTRKCSYCKDQKPRESFKLLPCGVLGIVCDDCREASARRQQERNEEAKRRQDMRREEHRARQRLEYQKKRDGKAKVYFFQVQPAGPIKIGFTVKSVRLRLKEVAIGSPWDVVCVGVMEVDGPDKEAELHRRFAHLHMRREWFRPGNDLLKFIVENSKAERKPAVPTIEDAVRSARLAGARDAASARRLARASGYRFGDAMFEAAWRSETSSQLEML